MPLASYAVNGLGQRVRKDVGATTTLFVYDEQGRLVGEYDGSGQLIQETVWLNDLPIATLRPTGTGMPTPIAMYYVHADHLGSPRAITRPGDNALLWRWDNTDPFGNNAANENPAGQGTFKYGLRFPGQYFDAETGTHYNYFRDYDPQSGDTSRAIRLDSKAASTRSLRRRTIRSIDLDPTGMLRKIGSGFSTMYGNWCGRNWSGGQLAAIIPTHPLAPIDRVDSAVWFMTIGLCNVRMQYQLHV